MNDAIRRSWEIELKYQLENIHKYSKLLDDAKMGYNKAIVKLLELERGGIEDG